MATLQKLPSGKWQAQVARKGHRKSASFDTKREAQDWATRQEYLVAQAGSQSTNQTFGDALIRYAKEESPKKRGARWEVIRIGRFAKDDIAARKLVDLRPADFAEWRDQRLKVVSPGTVKREMTLFSSVLTIARREWGLLSLNPMSDVRKPSAPAARDRRVLDTEIERLVAVAGTDLTRASARAVHAFRFAIETAMRAGEIVNLANEAIDRNSRVATLSMTKNGTVRKVPLSTAAISLLDALPETDGAVFALTSQQIDVLFRKVRDAAEIKNLRFHDSRHEAVTRLAKKIDVLSLARIVGHKDIKMLMVYYNETAEELAQRLD